MAAPADRSFVEGAAGRIEIAATRPATPRMVAVIAHPHPLFGGTMDNKVVTTLTRFLHELWPFAALSFLVAVFLRDRRAAHAIIPR